MSLAGRALGGFGSRTDGPLPARPGEAGATCGQLNELDYDFSVPIVDYLRGWSAYEAFQAAYWRARENCESWERGWAFRHDLLRGAVEVVRGVLGDDRLVAGAVDNLTDAGHPNWTLDDVRGMLRSMGGLLEWLRAGATRRPPKSYWT